MGLKKDRVDARRHGRTRKDRGKVTVTGRVSAPTPGSLDGMGGVEDRREALLPHPVKGPHVRDQVVVAEGRSPLREAESGTPRGLQLAGDRGDVPRGQKLPLFDVDGLARPRRGLDQVGLAAQKCRNLEQINEIGRDFGVLGRVNVRRDRSADGIAHLREHPASLHDTDSPERGSRGPVGLVVGGLEDELCPQVVANRPDRARRLQQGLLSLDHAGAEDEEGFCAPHRHRTDSERFRLGGLAGFLQWH